MKALFKHLSAITQGEPGSVADNTSYLVNKISTPFLSTTLLAVLLGVPQIPIIGSGKAVAQNTGSCPAGTAPATVQLNPSDSLQDLTQEYNIGGIRTVFTLTEEVPGQVIDPTDSRVTQPGSGEDDQYGGLPGPNLLLNIGPGKPPETGNLAPGSATLTITFGQSVTLESPLTLLDVDRNGSRGGDPSRIFQDVVTVTAANNNSNVPVNLQALGSFTRISGNTAFGIGGNSPPEEGDGNVSAIPQGPVDQIRLLYRPGREFGPPGQDQTIGLAPFTICAPGNPASIGDTVYRDNNGDGTQNPGEEGIPGINLTLTNPGPDGQFGTPDDTTETTTTDNNGIYNFPVPAGNYRVTVDNPPAGLTPTQTPPGTIVVGAGENFDIADFGFSPPQTGSIGDTVYTDGNRNNVQDDEEEGIPGATVTLVLPGPDGQLGTPDDTTQTTTTNDNGNYTFPNLPAGNYRVTATSPREGDTPTQTQLDAVELQPGQNLDTVDFGFVPGQLGAGQGIIGDTVYNDTNRNNQQDDGETGIPGATVTLINPGEDGEFGTPDDSTPQTTTTNENGNYSFPNLPAGNYRVTTTTPDGLTPTQTPDETVALAENQNLDTVDFGFAPEEEGTGSLGDTVYTDTNNNNQQDDGETGIPGVTVTLTGAGPDGQLGTPDDTTQTATTDSDGIYGFTNLPPANYRVTTETPEGLTPTQTQPDVINLQGGQNIDTIDFGFVGQNQGQGTGSIGDTVYSDTNSNNTQDDGEAGIPGATVTLTTPGPDGEFGTGDDITQNTTTNESGIYSFPNLPAGNYRVTTPTPQDFTATQTQSDTVNLQSGQNIDTVDFGFAPGQLGAGQGSIGDTVYNDINGNGQQDPGEPGIGGIIVNYAGTGPDGEFGNSLDDDDTSGRTSTDRNGNYILPNLPAGTYRITINDQSQEGIRGLTQTQTPNGLIDLDEGENFEDADFGYTQSTGTIGDTVYQDNDSNGTQNPNEPGIANVEVTLTRPGADNQLGTEDDTTDTTTTNNQGIYSFPNIPIGNYRVTVNNPPSGLNPTQTPPSTISLQENQTFNDADFGFSPQQVGTIGDFVFYDNDGDSIPDLNEIGIPGITLILRDTNGNEVARTTTGDNGAYNFNVAPGTYTVTIENPPQGLPPTLAQPNPVTLEARQNLDTVDFGFQPPSQGSIGDTVFADVNANRIQDEGEPGVSGVLVRLIRPGEDGVFGTSDDQIDEQRTDNTETLAFNQNTPGQYTFNNLPPGNYQVEIALPDGSILTTAVNPIPVTLQPNQNVDDADFGVRMTGLPGSIGDTVFNDTNGNGVQDYTDSNNNGVKEPNEAGEAGIPGVQLTLRDSEGRDFGTTTTNQNGNYTFNNLPLGTYTVESARPSDFSPTTETTLSAQLTQANPNTNEIDFGFRPGRLGASGATNLRLVKRITLVLRGNTPISGVAFNQFEDDSNDENDNRLNSSRLSSPVGITRLETPVQSGDIVEYTIYFLSEGREALQNVRICDLIPDGTTFDSIVQVNGGGNGADNGNFSSPLAPIPANFQNICRNGTPTNGAVLTNLGTLPAGGQFGFVRFRVRVN